LGFGIYLEHPTTSLAPRASPDAMIYKQTCKEVYTFNGARKSIPRPVMPFAANGEGTVLIYAMN
jgi:hypothetical protein